MNPSRIRHLLTSSFRGTLILHCFAPQPTLRATDPILLLNLTSLSLPRLISHHTLPIQTRSLLLIHGFPALRALPVRTRCYRLTMPVPATSLRPPHGSPVLLLLMAKARRYRLPTPVPAHSLPRPFHGSPALLLLTVRVRHYHLTTSVPVPSLPPYHGLQTLLVRIHNPSRYGITITISIRPGPTHPP